MGQRMPDEPIEYGDDCLACWPEGETPKHVYARFSNIVKCPDKNGHVCLIPPNDRMFRLTQDPGAACHFKYIGDVWEIFYWAKLPVDPLSRLNLGDKGGWTYFWDTEPSCAPEGFVFHNTLLVCGLFQCGKTGIAVVTWSPQATKLLSDINMQKANDLFMELRPRDDGKLVYKFCRVQDATNIKILLEPDI